MDLDADTALEQLYAAHWRRLVRLAVLLLRDQGAAEEVVQDAFVAMHGRWRSLRDPDKALAYLRQTVVNRSRSALRHRGVVERYVARQAPRRRSADPADRPRSPADRRTAVLDALRALPTRQREVLVLRHYLDLSEAEIADDPRDQPRLGQGARLPRLRRAARACSPTSSTRERSDGRPAPPC